MAKSDLEREDFRISYSLQSFMERKRGQAAKAGTGRQELQQRSWRNSAHWLAPIACLAYFFSQSSRPPAQQAEATHRKCWAFSHQSANRTTSPRHTYRSARCWHLLSWGFIFSDDPNQYQVPQIYLVQCLIMGVNQGFSKGWTKSQYDFKAKSLEIK